MPLGDAEERVRPVAAVVREHEGRDARRVGLEGQGQQIEHQPDVALVVVRDAGGLLDVRRQRGLEPLGCLRSAASSSRTAVRYSSSLRRSVAPRWPRSRGASSRTKSRMLACCRSRRARASADSSARPPPPNSRSNTSRGFVFGRHRRGRRLPGDVERVGAAIARIAVAGELVERSHPSSSEARRVWRPRRSAATWSTETPTRMSAPSVFRAWQAVRNVAEERAWSPAPSPLGRALSCASPLSTSRSSWCGFNGSRMRRQLETPPFGGRRPVRHVGAVGHEHKRHPPRRRRSSRRYLNRAHPRRHGVEERQAHRRAQAAQKGAPGHVPLGAENGGQ